MGLRRRTGDEVHAQDLHERNLSYKKRGLCTLTHLSIELEGGLRVLDTNHRVIEL